MYARVSAQYEWIRKQVCGLSDEPPAYMECTEEMKFSDTPSSQPTTTSQPTTSAPTYSQLPDGKMRLLIVVTLDDYPEETGWSLALLGSNDAIFEVPIGAYEGKDALQTKEYIVEVDENMFYQLTIEDDYADGFEGTIYVYEGVFVSSDARLVHEPGFSNLEELSHVFYVGDNPENILTLVFDFDPYPEEVAYELMDSDENILALQWVGSFEEGTESASIEIPIYSTATGDQEYFLILWDSGSDGLCCGGGYELYLGSPEENNLLISGGEYGEKESKEFIVEGTVPSMSPSVGPTVSLQPSTSVKPTYAMIGEVGPSAVIAKSNLNDENNMNQTPSTNGVRDCKGRGLGRDRFVYFFGSRATATLPLLLLLVLL